MDDSIDRLSPTTPVIPPHPDPIAVKLLHLRVAKYRERMAALLTFARRHSREHSTHQDQVFLRGVQAFLDEDA